MRNKSVYAAAALATAVGLAVNPARAEILQIAISGVVTDTFTLDTNSGIIDSNPSYLAFPLLTDSNGYNGAYFGDHAASGDIGAGLFDSPNHVHETYDILPSAVFYSGSGTMANLTPGTYQYSGSNYISGRSGAGTLVISDLPEPAGVLTLVTGVVGLGTAYRRRIVPSA
jgi:hypothetical protein